MEPTAEGGEYLLHASAVTAACMTGCLHVVGCLLGENSLIHFTQSQMGKEIGSIICSYSLFSLGILL